MMLRTFLILNFIVVTLVFAKPRRGCVPSGCSGEICADKKSSVVSTCIARPEAECYAKAKCERQKGGKCGWTESKELKECLDLKTTGPVFEEAK